MSDFTLETSGQIARKSETSESPEFGIEIVADDGERLDLRDETRDETILGFGATVRLSRSGQWGLIQRKRNTYLTLVKSSLVDFIL